MSRCFSPSLIAATMVAGAAFGFAGVAAAEAPYAVCFAPETPAWRVAEAVAHADAATGLVPGKFQGLPGTRWSLTASGGGTAQGEPTTLTWSYVPDGTIIPGFNGEPTSASSMRAWLNGLYGNFATWHAHFVAVFARWSELTGITYVYEPNDDQAAFGATPGELGVRGDVRIGGHFIDGNSNVLAYNFFPNNGDMVLDSGDSFFNNLSNNSRRLRNTLSHEHGHGLGMRHVCPINQTKLMEPFLTTAFDGPQHDDILGGQRGYGDTDESNDLFLFATGVAGGSLVDRSIDDDGDADWYSFAAAAGDTISVRIDPVGAGYLQGPQNANGSCSAGTSFNSLTRSDLALEVRSPGGLLVLASADETGNGGSEQINDLTLPLSGTHYVRVTGSDNAAQLFEMTLLGVGDTIFADGFESTNTSAWSQSVP